MQAEAVGADTSYNGWTVGTPASAIGVVTHAVPGSTATLAVRSGDVATVLIYFAGRFNAEVEALIPSQCGGYEYRRNVNNPSVWSNHASGTAIDLNWDEHPNGSKGTFDSGQVSAIRNILAYTGDVVYWGGDYSGTTDEMHFEINVPPGDSRLTSLAAGIRAGSVQPDRRVAFRAVNGASVVAENAGNGFLWSNRSAIGDWERFDLFNVGGNDIALRSNANQLYVCAESGGSGPLIANRNARGAWETFELIQNDDGTVSLRARANNLFVVAENGGNDYLRSNRSAIGAWERFELINL